MWHGRGPTTRGTHVFDEIEVCLPQVQVGAGQQAAAEDILDIWGLGLHADLCIRLPEQTLWQADRGRVAAAFLGVQGWVCTSVLALRPGTAASCTGAFKTGSVGGTQLMPHATTDKGPGSISGKLKVVVATPPEAPSDQHGIN